jgi:heme-degrading monooxygenase HmoA
VLSRNPASNGFGTRAKTIFADWASVNQDWLDIVKTYAGRGLDRTVRVCVESCKTHLANYPDAARGPLVVRGILVSPTLPSSKEVGSRGSSESRPPSSRPAVAGDFGGGPRLSVLEVARISVRSDQTTAFEQAFAEAHRYVQGAEGHLDSRLAKSVGADEYVFLVWWRSLADHVEAFAVSAEFGKFDELIAPYFASAPHVAHFDELEGA